MAAALLAVVLLSACGSHVDPETAARANGLSAIGVAGADIDAVGEDSGSVPGAAQDVDPRDEGVNAGVGGAGSSSRAGGPGPASTGGADTEAPAAPSVDTCSKLKNDTGITDDTVVLGNAADISGPIPGIFQSARDAATAYVAYYNATTDFCGRSIELKTYDTRTDSVGDQQAYLQGCDETFAMIGSMGAFDGGGAQATEDCGLPDIRSIGTSSLRSECATCFGTLATDPQQIPRGYVDYMESLHEGSTQKMAVLWVDVQAAEDNARASVTAAEAQGAKVIYQAGIGAAEFDFAPYVQRMKDMGVQYVRYYGPDSNTLKLRRAMAQQDFRPPVFLVGPGAFTQRFIDQAGEDGEGMYIWMQNMPFDAPIPEMELYRAWLERVRPGAEPDYFGMFAWSASRLALEKMAELGGDLSRESLIAAIRAEHAWDGNGMHTPMDVGGKQSSPCLRYHQFRDRVWQPVSKGDYVCQGIVDVG